jgi:hypothetical protein
MKNNKATFNLGNRRCLYDRPTWIGGRCPTIPLLRHSVLAVVLVKRFPLAKRQNTELACIPPWSDYDNRWYICVQPNLCGILNYCSLQTCRGNGKGFPFRDHAGLAVQLHSSLVSTLHSPEWGGGFCTYGVGNCLGVMAGREPLEMKNISDCREHKRIVKFIAWACMVQ